MREPIAFAEQNLITDPPFSKLDLISCRNLLIYVEPELQKKIITLFNYTLNDNGYLLLGTSETVGRLHNLFELKDKKARIYQRLNQAKQPQVDFPILSLEGTPRRGEEIKQRLTPRRIIFSDLTHRLLSDAYAPASVLINRNGEPLFLFGPTDRYLKLPSGELSQDIVAMARGGLTAKLRGLIHKAIRTNEPVSLKSVRINRNDGHIEVSVAVSPVREPREAEGLFLVAFTEERDVAPAKVLKKSDDEGGVSEAAELERELQSTREDLQSTMEEMETSNEELKASNEEAMSMNEELQSTNEELETSKEEMQSLNEELSTVNSELQENLDQLEASRNDISNLLASTNIPTIFLDTDLRIKRFTPPVSQLFNIVQTDEGRKLSDFTKTLHDPHLLEDCAEVLAKLVPLERELIADNNIHYVRRILPYRTEENKIEGVVMTFVDITRIKEAEVGTKRLAAVVQSSNDAVTLQGMNGQILAWNRGAEKMYGYKEAQALSLNVRDLVPKEGRNAALDLIYQTMDSGRDKAVFTKRLAKDKRVIDVWLTVTVLKDDSGKPYAVATTERDVTKRLRLEDDLRRSRDELEIRVEERTQELKEAVTALVQARDEAVTALVQARDEAEAANAAKSNFLAAMSHDLRTPLNGILGFSEAIMTDQLGLGCDTKCSSQIRNIFEAGTHLHALINDILDISAVEAGKLELHEEDVDISEILESCRRLIRSDAKNGGIDLKISAAKDVSKLFADSRRMKQILVNLLSNAIKFSGDAKTVSLRIALNKKGDMTFRIADKGIGMSKDEIALALEPFSQVDSSLSRATEGTGLGLPIARELSEAHGGALTVRSKPGEGTAITVCFPAERVRS